MVTALEEGKFELGTAVLWLRIHLMLHPALMEGFGKFHRRQAENYGKLNCLFHLDDHIQQITFFTKYCLMVAPNETRTHYQWLASLVCCKLEFLGQKATKRKSDFLKLSQSWCEYRVERYYYFWVFFFSFFNVSYLKVFHTSVSWWFSTRVWETASHFKSPGLFLVFWPISTML